MAERLPAPSTLVSHARSRTSLLRCTSLLYCRYLVCRTPYESLAEARLTAGQDPLLRLFKGELRLSDRSK